MDILKIAEKWGVMGLAALASIFYLSDKGRMMQQCNVKHTKVDEKINSNFTTLSNKIDDFEKSTIKQLTESKERIEGIAARITNHYQGNDKRYLEILESNKKIFDELSRLRK